MELGFYNQELEVEYRIDLPLLKTQLDQEWFRWVVEGRCCIGGKGDRNWFIILDLKQKKTQEVELGEDDRFFENTTVMISLTCWCGDLLLNI